MTKVVNNYAEKRNQAEKLVNDKEVRSLAKWVRTHGEYRSGLTTTTDNGTLVPDQILNTVETLTPEFNLKPYTNVVPVRSAKGDYPVMDPEATAHTKAELAKYPDVDNDINTVPFKIQTYAGRIQLSNELLEDEAIPLTPELSKQLAIIMTNTQNALIMDKMKNANAINVSSADDLINNIDNLDPRFLSNVFITQKALGKVMTLKDKNDDYIFRMNASGNNTLLGLPCVTIPAYLDNTASIYVGNLKYYINYFDRLQTTLTWNNNNVFGQSLAAVLRGDTEVAIPEAMEKLTFGASSNGASGSAKGSNSNGNAKGSNGSSKSSK